MNAIRMSNSSDPDQARQNVGPDLGPDCLQKLSADNKIKLFKYYYLMGINSILIFMHKWFLVDIPPCLGDLHYLAHIILDGSVVSV